MGEVELIGENGAAIGIKKISDVDKLRDSFKVACISVYNSLGEVYVVEISGPDNPRNAYFQKYGISAAGIIRKDEDPENAAKRILKKELGVDGKLEFLGCAVFNSNSAKKLGHFFSLKHDGDIIPDKQYAEKGEFVSQEMIENMIYQDKDLFSSGFMEFWGRFRDKLKQK